MPQSTALEESSRAQGSEELEEQSYRQPEESPAQSHSGDLQSTTQPWYLESEDEPEIQLPPSSQSQQQPLPKPPPAQQPIIPSDYRLEKIDTAFEPVFTAQPLPDNIRESVSRCSWTPHSPASLEALSYLQITYLDFSGKTKVGELIIHTELAQEVLDIFGELYRAQYPIAQIQRIESYDGDDQKSMEDNNTYGYNTRMIQGIQRLSLHSYGSAVDINPLQNPYIVNGKAYPEKTENYLDRRNNRRGMIRPGDACYNAFVSRGWVWGGDWDSPDYQHFEKVVEDRDIQP